MNKSFIFFSGECREISACKTAELEDFPRRMREWLFNVMEELSDRSELSEYYQELQKEAKINYQKRWENAAIWKWCDLGPVHLIKPPSKNPFKATFSV